MLKRPMATIGFSMLLTFLLITNITHKTTIALLIGAIVVFCCFIIVKNLRKYLSVIFALFGVIVFTFSFVSAERYYLNETKEMKNEQTLIGVVCATPTDSDYAFSYIIKPTNKNYKVIVVSDDDMFLCEGDYVKIVGICQQTNEEIELFEHSLSSKVYFTFFEGDECVVKKTGDVNWYYKNIGVVKRNFTEIITKYLPGRNGSVVTAITIGDKSELDKKIVDNFNYCGTSHLLVISGLHLTLWSTGIIRILYLFPKLRRKAPFIGLCCLFIYASITGFSVSVLRAGAMVGTMLLARTLNRDADSINSIGFALTFILLLNPFAPFSSALWLTVLSTLGILVYSGNVLEWIREITRGKAVSKIPLYNLLVTTVAVSFSTTVFTLPVFILKFRMVSVVSIISNFLMVELAMIMMICSVLGVVFHFVFRPFAKLCFMLSGTISEFLCYIAEKIGMAEWSTISLSHKYYTYFIFIVLIVIFIVFCVRKKNTHIKKHITVFFTVAFIMLAVYCTTLDYNTPTVEIIGTDKSPVVTVNYMGESVMIGAPKKKYIEDVKRVLNKHNKKYPDSIFITDSNDRMISEMIYVYHNLGEVKTYFYESSPKIFDEFSQGNLRTITINKTIEIRCIEKNCVIISAYGKRIVITDWENVENIFENKKEYDIIFLSGKNSTQFEDFTKYGEIDAKVFFLGEKETATVCF